MRTVLYTIYLLSTHPVLFRVNPSEDYFNRVVLGITHNYAGDQYTWSVSRYICTWYLLNINKHIYTVLSTHIYRTSAPWSGSWWAAWRSHGSWSLPVSGGGSPAWARWTEIDILLDICVDIYKCPCIQVSYVITLAPYFVLTALLAYAAPRSVWKLWN